MHWIIDRFEESFAILENTETLEIKEYPRTKLPKDVKEGNVLAEYGGKLYINQNETKKRAARIRERFNRLKNFE